ncbi:hypothetical protein SAMN05428970_3283 [Agromyces sp. CF514]|nr:hypothetical protein SAMN05428970_3283 [Agromyces sp. CF514]
MPVAARVRRPAPASLIGDARIGVVAGISQRSAVHSIK